LKQREYNPEDIRRQFSFLVFAVLFAFMILIIRLWYLQIIRGDDLKHLSENNRIRLVRIPAPRGRIQDSQGKILVDNRPAFDVSIIPEEVTDWQELSRNLGKILAISPEDIERVLSDARGQPKFLPFKVKRDISWEELASIEENKFYLPGIVVEVEAKRSYLHGTLAAHLLGTIGEITPQQLRDKKFAGYRAGNIIGRSGIEIQFEKHFKGKDGGRQVEVTAAGREIKVLNEVGSVPGHAIQLTIDLDLQIGVEAAFGQKAGAVVVMDPRNGKILAMLSRPSFDPNIFAGNITSRQWKEIVMHPLHPLENRAIRGQYPPGSIFKIVTALAGLSEGEIGIRDEFYCPGYYRFGKRNYRCWKRGGHGSISIHRAIVESCDVFFYNLGHRLGIDRLSRYARMLGLGRLTGIELPGESRGLIPDAEWKKKALGEPWYPGETISASIGQGYILVTPIQMAVLTSASANGGHLYRPIIVERVLDTKNKSVLTAVTEIKGTTDLQPKNLEIIRRALRGVVHEPRGTGSRSRLPDIEIGGKTGTAQVTKLRNRVSRGQKESTPYQFRDHAWFVCFAPWKNPEVVVVVLVEHGGHGGSVAAPIAKQILKRFFHLKRLKDDRQKVASKY